MKAFVIVTSSTDNLVPSKFQVGSMVLVRLHDGRFHWDSQITAIVSRPTGQKVHIAFGAYALIVDEAQIVETVRGVRT